MSTDNEHIRREQQPPELLIPTLDKGLTLSDEQKTFLQHAIRDLPNDAVDLDAEIADRVTAVQRSQIYPYPCIRGFYYAELRISGHTAFTRILELGKAADAGILLDIGCCMGTDLRYLVHAGYNPASVIGCDIRQTFIDLGYELYADRGTCPIPFFSGDVFDIVPCPFPAEADKSRSTSLRDVTNLDELRGRVKYVYAGSLFHLFDEGTQEAVARRLVTLLDVTPGSGPAVVFGRQLGQVVMKPVDDSMGRIRCLHSPVSWEQLWRRTVGETRRVDIDAVLPLGLSETDEGSMWWNVWIGDHVPVDPVHSN